MGTAIVQGDLCDNIGLVLAYLPSGAMSSTSRSHHDPSIPILSPVHVLFLRLFIVVYIYKFTMPIYSVVIISMQSFISLVLETHVH